VVETTNPMRLAAEQAIVRDVAEIYACLDRSLDQVVRLPGACRQCGRCCDFEAYGHRLFVTTPEWVHFRQMLGDQPIRPMPSGRCPYNQQGRCDVYTIRFSGCRIFACQMDPQVQSDLTESALARLKALCVHYAIPYRYVDLGAALNGRLADIGL